MDDKRTRELRRSAWVFLCLFAILALIKSYLLYGQYTTIRDGIRTTRLSMHYNHVREIQSLEPTSQNIALVATNYLNLGLGAIYLINKADDAITWSLIATIGLCFGGILVPLKVLRFCKASSGKDEKK
jgi:hypothetical protein